MKRGDLYLMQYKTGKLGRETFHSVPVVVLQNNLGNTHSKTTLIAMTCSDCVNTESPVHVRVDIFNQEHIILLDNIHTMNKKYLTEYIGELSCDELTEVEEGLLYSFGMVDQFVH